jgi:hypothetical protein
VKDQVVHKNSRQESETQKDHFKRAEEIVKQWPEWKRESLVDYSTTSKSNKQTSKPD